MNEWVNTWFKEVKEARDERMICCPSGNFIWLLGPLAVNAKSGSPGRDNTSQAAKQFLFLLSQ